MHRVGFMQGRLSPLVGGRIQAFPWDGWREEFAAGAGLGFHLMEWTLDQERLYENPLMTVHGQGEIRELCRRHDFAIPSLTGDCFMQAPFWKAVGAVRESLHRDFDAIAAGCSAVGIGLIVMPLVDAGRLDDAAQENDLLDFLNSRRALLSGLGVRVVFESDFPPAELRRFIARLDRDRFGINYDIGNSAGIGYSPAEELAAYGERIDNVHVKDRILGGPPVPLGTGNADFEAVFDALRGIGYRGRYILQTARAADGDHAAALARYRDLTTDWIRRHAA